MDKDEMKNRFNTLVEQYGPWTAHNIKLDEDFYTRNEHEVEHRSWFYSQIIWDLFGGKVNGLRVLDLGCLEGQFCIELGIKGFTCVGVEGRQSNVSKAIFARDALGLRNVEFVRDDIRNITSEKYGKFDIIINSGVLYHLDSSDLFTCMENLADACTRVMLVDTHISYAPEECVKHGNIAYWGHYYVEFEQAPDVEILETAHWSSMGNMRSFWVTKASLLNILKNTGFSTTLEACSPRLHHEGADRVTLIALKGVMQPHVSFNSEVPGFATAPVGEPGAVNIFALESELEKCHAELTAVYSSKSWKLTSSISRTLNWFRRSIR
jgi:SAM-dependent methyltransferase